jgi:hypothetical protein
MVGDFSRDYDLIDDRPLPIRDLVGIWRGLAEHKRFSFFLSLREDLADQLLAATHVTDAGTPAPDGRAGLPPPRPTIQGE